MPWDKQLVKSVGRMLVGRLPATELDDRTASALGEGTIGGICLFKENASDLEQLTQLVAAIRQNAADPIICVDQEGGAVQRFDHILSTLPSMMAIAATGKLENARSMARISAVQLAAVGINCVLAPVLDVASHYANPIIGTRAFSSNPATVAEFGKAMLQTFNRSGIVSVGKHFPGHGGTAEDSHSELAVNHARMEVLRKRDLAPFVECLPHARGILTAHVWVSALDEDPLPASLSANACRRLLREEFNYDGVIFTDDMTMKAVSDKYGLGEASIRAIEAGADVILLCSGTEGLVEAHAKIVQAVQSGRLKEQAIIEANLRIEREFAKSASSRLPADLATLKESIEEGAGLSLAVSRAALTQLKGQPPSLKDREWLIVAPAHPRYKLPLADEIRKAAMDPHWRANQTGAVSIAKCEEWRYPPDPSEEDCLRAAHAAKGKNVLFLTFRAFNNRGQSSLGSSLRQSAASIFGIAADTPYDSVALPDIPNYICTFDPSNGAVKGLAQVLVSGEELTGTCPVDVSAAASSAGA
ncbi:MAG TPA: beta-N-acetylhexosaminidase [Candidatus Obscuribacterales bacterium]